MISVLRSGCGCVDDADPVNTAARLSVLAEKRGVLVLATESLKNHLRGNHKTMLSVKLQPMGSVMLKGKTEETQLFVPQVAHLGSRGRSFRVAQSTPEKLVDRSEHCDAVQAFVQQHCTRQVAGRAPRPGLLVIHGANGSGRSSLIDCFEQMVGRSSPDQTCVEVVRIVALGKVQPFNGLARILQAVLQLRDTQAHAEFMADLTVCLLMPPCLFLDWVAHHGS